MTAAPRVLLADDHPALARAVKGTLEASVMGYSFTEAGKKEPAMKEEVVYELDQYPEDRTEKDLERHVAPAIRAHMKNFLECLESRQKPVADIEQGYISTTACILANISMALGRAIHLPNKKKAAAQA